MNAPASLYMVLSNSSISPESDCSDLSGNELASVIESLTTHSLLQASGFEEKTYSLHPLTYRFAVSQAAQKPGAEEIGVRADV